MTTTSHRTAFLPNGRECFAVEHPDGRLKLIWPVSGGAPDGDPPADPPAPSRITWDQVDWENGPQLTDSNLPKPIQETLNRALAKDRREHERRLGEVQTQLREQGEKRATLETELSEFRSALEALQNPAPPESTDDPLKPPAELAKHPHLSAAWIATRKAQLEADARAKAAEDAATAANKALEKLTKDLDAERQTRTAGEQKMLDLRRDREVLGILSQLKVLNPKLVLPLYTQNVVYQADTDSFAYRNAEGELVELEKGVSDAIPDNFLPPTIANGGSGAHGGNGTVRTPPPAPADQRVKLTQERDTIQGKRAQGARLSTADHARLLAIGRELQALGPASS